MTALTLGHVYSLLGFRGRGHSSVGREGGRNSKLIWNLAGFKVGSTRIPGCGQVAGKMRGVDRAVLGAPEAPLPALLTGPDFPA